MKIKNKKNKGTLFLLILPVGLFFGVIYISNTQAATLEEQCVFSGGTFGSLTSKCTNCGCGKVTGPGQGAVCVTKEEYDLAVSFVDPSTAPEIQVTECKSVQAKTVQEKPKQFKYKLLESFPGFFTGGNTMTDLPALILAIYKFGIWTVGIAGLFMLVVGGFMYMTSAGNTSSAGNARGIITDALLGIVAALGAYLILYVINPDFTTLNLKFTPVEVTDVDLMPAGGKIPTEGQLTDSAARQNLATVGITVNKDNCPNVGATNCTSLDGIPVIAISHLMALQNACKQFNASCKIMVTGGTESGHKSHGPGNPMIDIREDAVVTSFLKTAKASQQYSNYGIGQVCTVSQQDLGTISYNHDYSKVCQDPSATAHFHISFSG